MGILRHLLTGRDNQTHDMGRWSWLVCTLSVLGHDAYQLYKGVTVDVKDLGVALCAVAAAHGVAIGMKAKTEPAGGEQ
jgi:hypothetical protein